VRLYGRDAAAILKEASRSAELGEPPFADLPYCLAELIYLCKSEQVCHLLDLVKRRTSIYFLADDGGQAVLPRIVDRIAPVLDWDAERRAAELSAVRDEFEADCRALGNRATLGGFGVPVMGAADRVRLAACPPVLSEARSVTPRG
jgi:glycerol-3-phosphate dehydrogenase